MPDQNVPLTAAQLDAYREARTGGDRSRLEWAGFKVFSQSDEDGIIERIFSIVGVTDRRFVEFGCEAGLENNTRYLLAQGWRGLWMEGNPDYARSVRSFFSRDIASGNLVFRQEIVRPDNINLLLTSSGFTGEIDLLSIDIDSNDHHVFDAISVVSPRVVCLEHNHGYPPGIDWAMPYDPDFRWDPTSGAAPYGASITHMATLAARKGYVLVGCGLCSANGFYVRADLIADRFVGPFTPERLFNPLDYEMVLRFPVRLDAAVRPRRPGLIARARRFLTTRE
jgi:hypothetical protein